MAGISQLSELILHTEQETVKFVQKKLAGSLEAGDIIALTGDLGTGKTFICREIIKYFCGPNTKVASPTFNLLQTYVAPGFTIFHYDLYRLKYIDEIYELGFEDALKNNLILIEWPEIIESIIPLPYIKIDLQIKEGNRRLAIAHFKNR